MNRSVNILLILFSFPAMFFSIIVGFNLPIPYQFKLSGDSFLGDAGEVFPSTALIFYVLAALLLMIIGRRSVHRWVGVGMTRKPERFDWVTEIGKERKKNVQLFLGMEAVVALSFAIGHAFVTPQSWPLVAVYVFMFVDQLLFMLIAKNWFRVGITQKALVTADREVNVLYFSGLRRVEVHQQTVYFEYIEDLQLFFQVNAIPTEKWTEFKDQLEAHLDRDKVYFSEKFKQL